MPSKIKGSSVSRIDEHSKQTLPLGDPCSGKETTKGNFLSEDKRDLKLIVLTLLFTNGIQLFTMQIRDSVEKPSNWTVMWPLIILIAFEGMFLLLLSSDKKILITILISLN